jgi:hypothetical protein
MALEFSPVFRQLDAKSRFARFEPTDAIPVFLLYSVTYLGSYAFGYAPLYAFAALASAAVATYFLRTRFEFGLMGLLRFLLYPKHFSALAADRCGASYPARRRLREGSR